MEQPGTIIKELSLTYQCEGNARCHGYPCVCTRFYARDSEQVACLGGVSWAIQTLGHNLQEQMIACSVITEIEIKQFIFMMIYNCILGF